uniref:HECT-type E3 ubiquitin transferase n=1 Tax=Ananas comosus var. bracteatus TaxID=296719 RepID=A0A6V7PK29_ANACO|nr:unnamed protein product [Ananas comosus var. bracteatus]
MLIDWSNLLAESFEYILHASPSVLRYGLPVGFKNEQATGPGVTREWFCLVCRKVFSPENVLFLACPSDRRRLDGSFRIPIIILPPFCTFAASSTHSVNLEYFKFSGRLIALALMHEVQIGITFDRTFFLQLAGKPITLEDVKDADPFLYLSCKWILDMDPDLVDSDALGLTFSRDVEVVGSIKNVELGTGGKDIVVNSSNREYYVNLLIKHSFVTSVAYQMGCGYNNIFAVCSLLLLALAANSQDSSLQFNVKDFGAVADGVTDSTQLDAVLSVQLRHGRDGQWHFLGGQQILHMNIFSSSNFALDLIKISAPGDSPNTDGIHIGDSTDIRITNSVIGTGTTVYSVSGEDQSCNISQHQRYVCVAGGDQDGLQRRRAVRRSRAQRISLDYNGSRDGDDQEEKVLTTTCVNVRGTSNGNVKPASCI